jgi:toxin-antitoxin system PIN domain toxin
VIVPDVNLLVYAVHQESPEHLRARPWLDALLAGDEPVGFPWVVLMGFVRITTNPRVMHAPWSVDEAVTLVDQWLAQPASTVIDPTGEHWRILSRLLREGGRGASLTTDTHLAALCIERGAVLHSADNDFARFKSLRWVNPLAIG